MQGAGAQLSSRIWYSSSAGAPCLPPPGLFSVPSLSHFVVYVSVVWAVASEQAPGCYRFLGGDGESLAHLLAKSLAESRLGKAATAAKRDFVPKPLGARLGAGITPGLLLGLMTYLISHVSHDSWGSLQD